MDHLLLDLEIDAACWEFLAARIVARGGTRPAQPVVLVLDAAPPEDQDEWDELTARAERMYPAPGQKTMVERMFERMEG